MSDERPPQPPEKPTVQIPQVPDWAIELMKSVNGGLDRIDMRFESVDQNVEMLVGQGRAFGKWRAEVEEWRQTVDHRFDRNSTRVKSVSENDLAQEAKLSEFVVWRQDVQKTAAETKALAESAVAKASSLELKTDAQTATLKTIETALTGFLSHPRVKQVAWAVSTALLAYLASKGIK